MAQLAEVAVSGGGKSAEAAKPGLASARERELGHRLREVPPSVEALWRANKRHLQMLRDEAAEDLADTRHIKRPQTRGDCEDGERPCPWVGCKFNLYLESEGGSVRYTFPDLQPDEMPAESSCALDIAERGGATLEEVGDALNVTRERARQMESKAIEKVQRGAKRPGAMRELAAHVADGGWEEEASPLANLMSSGGGGAPEYSEEENSEEDAALKQRNLASRAYDRALLARGLIKRLPGAVAGDEIGDEARARRCAEASRASSSWTKEDQAEVDAWAAKVVLVDGAACAPAGWLWEDGTPAPEVMTSEELMPSGEVGERAEPIIDPCQEGVAADAPEEEVSAYPATAALQTSGRATGVDRNAAADGLITHAPSGDRPPGSYANHAPARGPEEAGNLSEVGAPAILTDRQQRVHAFVWREVNAGRAFPTNLEIAQACDINGSSAESRRSAVGKIFRGILRRGLALPNVPRQQPGPKIGAVAAMHPHPIVDGVSLTERQRLVLDATRAGTRASQIAEVLGSTRNAVQNVQSSLRHKGLLPRSEMGRLIQKYRASPAAHRTARVRSSLDVAPVHEGAGATSVRDEEELMTDESTLSELQRAVLHGYRAGKRCEDIARETRRPITSIQTTASTLRKRGYDVPRSTRWPSSPAEEEAPEPPKLSPKQAKVLVAVKSGKSEKQIAASLRCTPNAAKAVVTVLRRKGALPRTPVGEAISRAVKENPKPKRSRRSGDVVVDSLQERIESLAAEERAIAEKRQKLEAARDALTSG